ncbi:MAG: hypothetical protein JSU96_08840 [Acidobacteriota bacterium]|nr:MAG: hypothetical protein JSU96_08840 [Acidobacteriota bacterium]
MDRNEFLRESEQARTGIIREFLHFLAHNKKWWLLPIILVLLVFGLLLVLGGTAAGPFIYPLF